MGCETFREVKELGMAQSRVETGGCVKPVLELCIYSLMMMTTLKIIIIYCQTKMSYRYRIEFIGEHMHFWL